MGNKNKKKTNVNTKNSNDQEIEGLEITISSLLKNHFTENDEIIIQLRKMIKEKK